MLTAAQKLTLRTHVQANATQLAFSGGQAAINTTFAGESLNAGDAQLIAEHYNALASPDFFGFPGSVAVDTVVQAIVPSEYLVLSGQAATTNLHHNGIELLLRNGVMHPQSVAVRTWLQTLFPNATAPNTRTAILAACTRKATNVEKVLATDGTGPAGGNGSANNAAAILNFEGTISGNDISDIKGLPA